MLEATTAANASSFYQASIGIFLLCLYVKWGKKPNKKRYQVLEKKSLLKLFSNSSEE